MQVWVVQVGCLMIGCVCLVMVVIMVLIVVLVGLQQLKVVMVVCVQFCWIICYVVVFKVLLLSVSIVNGVWLSSLVLCSWVNIDGVVLIMFRLNWLIVLISVFVFC